MSKNPDEKIADDIGEFWDDPLGYVMYIYPWDSDPQLQLVKLPKKWADKYNQIYGPDEWACNTLEEIGAAVRANKFNGKKAVDPIQVAVSSGHGIGKSAGTGWIVNWVMDTRPHAQGTVTANTMPQLQTKTWAQIAKWRKLGLTSHWFEVGTGKGSMRMYHKQSNETWFCTAQTCREENSEAFAGQHAATSTSFYVFDEASAVPDKIWEVAEGGLTDGEPMIFVFGNPTRNTGRFYDCFNSKKHRWITKKVDSRTVQITNKSYIDQLIQDEGIDSDYVKVRVLGQFPSQSINQLIARGLAEEASKRKIILHHVQFAPVILGVDPAWEGDDRSTIVLRQGLHSKIIGAYRKIDNTRLAELVNQYWTQYKADAVFIDMGWGAGVIDYLRRLGRNPLPVNFGASALNPEYVNKRTEMWCEMKKWLEDGGQLEDNEDLIEDLVGPELHFQLITGKKLLEPKQTMKGRGLVSPDLGDALALTFAAPVQKQTEIAQYSKETGKCVTEYDVLG